MGHQPTQNLRLGTLPYMSPEQLDGDPRIDTLTDIYALGLIFYELCLGHPVLEKVVTTHNSWTENARQLRNFIFSRLESKEWSWVAAKACAYDRPERYQTAEALLNDLRAIARGTMVSAGKNDRLYRIQKFGRKYRTAIIAVTAAMVFLATVAFMGVKMATREHEAATKIRQAMVKQEKAEKETRIAASDARLREANLALTRDDAGEALRIIDLALELHPKNDQALYFRNFLLATRFFARPLPALTLTEKTEQIEMHNSGFLINGTEVIPQPNRRLSHPAKDIVIHDDQMGRLTFTSAKTGESLLTPLIYGSGFEQALFSPEHGAVCATTPEGTIQLWDVSGLSPQAETAAFRDSIAWLTFEREKDNLWLVDEMARLHLWTKKLNPIGLAKVEGFEPEFFEKFSLRNRREYLWRFWQGGNQRGLAGGASQTFRAMLSLDQHTKKAGSSLMISTMARDEDVAVIVDSLGWIGIRNEKEATTSFPNRAIPSSESLSAQRGRSESFSMKMEKSPPSTPPSEPSSVDGLPTLPFAASPFSIAASYSLLPQRMGASTFSILKRAKKLLPASPLLASPSRSPPFPIARNSWSAHKAT